MPECDKLLHLMAEHRASDLHLVAGQRPHWRQMKILSPVPDLPPFTAEALDRFVQHLVTKAEYEYLQDELDLDIAITYPQIDGYRFRINVRCQSGTLALSIRALPPVPNSPEALGLPPSAARLAAKPRGLILVTGPTNSGKSTTLAALIQQINMTRACHVITIEDPIEYVFPPGLALIEQRQIMRDAVSYETALHAVLRQDPDVVMIGELRNTDTVRAAVNMAEAGHLTMATAHAPTAVDALARLVGMVPEQVQDHFRAQLGAVLEGIIAQQLIPHRDQRHVALAAEVLLNTQPIRNLIMEKKLHQINSCLDTEPGAQSLTMALTALVRTNKITKDTALAYAPDAGRLRAALTQ